MWWRYQTPQWDRWWWIWSWWRAVCINRRLTIIMGMFQPSGQQGRYKDAGKCRDQCAVQLELCHLQIVTFGLDASFMWQVFHDSLSPGLGLYCLQPRSCSDRSRLTLAILNQLGTPETFSHDLKTQAAHLVQVEVGHYDAVEGDGERHQARRQLKTYKGPQHLMAIEV